MQRRPFTVEQLAEFLLTTYPGNIRLLGDGFEDGYEDPVFKRITVQKDKNYRWWRGQYQRAPARREEGPPFEALIFSTVRRNNND